MTATLSQFEIALLRRLKDSLPVCERPFAEMARALGVEQTRVIDTVSGLRACGIVRRFRPSVHYRSLGRIASLVTAHVPHDKFDPVADAVSRLPGVSHNYCRDHHYNLWFTLQAGSLIGVDVILDGLRDDFEIEFHSLPAERLFKLSFQLDPAGPDPASLGSQNPSVVTDKPVSDIPPVPVALTEPERAVLACVQRELPVCERPFESVCPPGVDIYPLMQSLQQKGVLGRLAAVPDYTKLGYTANALFCLEVPEESAATIGTDLASYNLVSHCYLRRTFAGWPFNLYAMCHAGQMQTIEDFARQFCAAHALQRFQLLPTVSELKKEPVIAVP